MTYKNIFKGTFLSRPNRFIANVMINGKACVCHVKNTGRCKELLVQGATVLLEKSSNPNRKTEYDLIAVYKGNRLINMDSSAPNEVAYEWLKKQYPDAIIKREKTWKDSRFDFYIENDCDKLFIEVKGVTLENNGIVLFPDAPTLRGVKHLNGLTQWVKEGGKAMALFVVQMSDVKYFTPNKTTHPEFAQALKEAQNQGVEVKAVDCTVSENSLTINKEIQVIL